jgi:RNA polymerase sigma factor (sigma-70 family)
MAIQKTPAQRTNIRRARNVNEGSPYWTFLERNGLKEGDLSEEDIRQTTKPNELTDAQEKQLQAVREALFVLSPLERQIIELYGFEGLRLEQVAKKLHTNMGTIQKSLHRAKAKILKHYQQNYKA